MSFINIAEVKKKAITENDFIQTGLKLIDDKILGLGLGQVSIISGSNASGKSTVVGQFLLQAVNQHFKAALFSGELPNTRAKDWLYLQAAGAWNIEMRKSKYNEKMLFSVKKNAYDEINQWLDNQLYIDDNTSYNIKVLGKNIQDLLLQDRNVKLVAIDNLMSIDISMLDAEKWEAQKKLIMSMCKIAKDLHVHIIFVAHPTKSMSFIRKENIYGSSDIANAVDTIMIVHRNSTDFKKRSSEYLGIALNNKIYDSSNVIEICKNRDFGVVDQMCPFWFDIASKRFLNSREEEFRYNWEKKEQESIFTDDEELWG